MAFPLAAIGAGLASSAGGSLLGGLFGGNDVPTYEPSKLMKLLGGYAETQIKPTKSQKQAILKEAATYGSPGAEEAFLQSYVGKFASPFIEKRLAKSYKKPIDFEAGPYRDVASYAYGQQGLGLPEDAFQKYINLAKATNVRSPEAFSDIVRSGMIASDMVKTPADLMFEAEKGPIARDPSSGRLLRGLFAYNPDTVKRLTASMLGTT
jgi:hypothetical protein